MHKRVLHKQNSTLHVCALRQPRQQKQTLKGAGSLQAPRGAAWGGLRPIGVGGTLPGFEAGPSFR